MASPSSKDIVEVSRACGCDEARARTLLMMYGNNLEDAIGAGKLAVPRSSTPNQPGMSVAGSSGNSSASAESLSVPRKPVADSSTGNVVDPSWHSRQSIPGEYPSDSGKPDNRRNETPVTPPYLGESDAPPINFYSPNDVKFSGSDDGEDTHKIPVEPPPGVLTPPSEKEPIQYGDGGDKQEVSQVPTSPQDVPDAPDLSDLQEPIKKPDDLVKKDPANSKWDFTLPLVNPPKSFVPGGKSGTEEFSMRDVVGAVQNGVEFKQIYDYLQAFDRSKITKALNQELYEFPTIFFAVARNDEQILRLWIDCGADVNAIHKPTGMPLLAFAVANVDNIFCHTTNTVATLLACGASPKVIPKAFYTPYSDNLPEDGPLLQDMRKSLKSSKRKWSTPKYIRRKLGRTLNLSQRFYMHRAVTMGTPKIRQTQVARFRNAEPILGLEYFLIGQTGAVSFLKTRLLTYLTLKQTRPLVLVFAGPSGHGKTELAKQMGHLLSLPTEIVDCTQIRQETDLFGHRVGVVGAQKGSNLNKFIAENDNKRGIVFLDEFEKTSQEVHHSLLIPFDNGRYEDRRSGQIVDCSKLIWILATNALDPTIKDFCDNRGIIEAENQETLLTALKELSQELKKQFKPKFGAPLTGRISSIIPFIPFSIGEQAVVAHKFVLETADKIRAPVCLKQTDNGIHERLFGNVYLRLRQDSSVCRLLAAKGYDPDLGARSLMTTVAHQIVDPLVEEYLDVRDEIKEGQSMKEFVLSEMGGELQVRAIGEYNTQAQEPDSEDDGDDADDEIEDLVSELDSDDEG